MDVNRFGDDEESADATTGDAGSRESIGAGRAASASTTAVTTAPGRDGLDLTPRQAAPPKKRQWWAFALLAVIIAAVGFVAVKALSDATLFFYNADEAVAMRDQLGTDRFRLQGTVESGTIVETADTVDFDVQFNGVEVSVSHRGDPPELFEAGTPVVLEGHWNEAGEVFLSDRMLVKHDESYEEDNGERIKEAEEGGRVPVDPSDPDVAP